MSKEDYRDKIEEHRQSFEEETDQTTLSRASRVKRNGGNLKKPKNTKRTTPLMTILFIIFILIPSSILIYFLAFYEPGKTIEEAEKDSSGSPVEVAKPGDNSGDKVTIESEDKEDKADIADKDDKQAQEQSKKDAELLAAQEAKKVADAKKAEEAAAAKRAEEARKAEEERKAKEEAAAKVKTYTVKDKDNLYRIALNHYGDGSEATLAKIRAANGMSSDIVQVGQVIKLP
ncbi:LysM peptidoglycan-binding domain-containing protein [Lysinibacillus sp. NPDC097287]|uniref:LysM peptidoglycan-binding domain-containing protein n=1 Tax=Lysinibacillus sp. NPDC097287 TaxID=3364144 RepID=UPI003823159B